MIKYLIIPICISVSGCATQVDLMRIDNQQKLAEMREIRKANLEKNYFKTLQKQFDFKLKASVALKNPIYFENEKNQEKQTDRDYSVSHLDTLSEEECNLICSQMDANCKMTCPETCDNLYGDCVSDQLIKDRPKDKPVKQELYKNPEKQVVYNFGDGNTISGSTSGITSFGSNSYKGPLESLGASIAKEYTKDQDAPIKTTGEQAMSFAGKLIKPFSDTIKVLGIAKYGSDVLIEGFQQVGSETINHVGSNQVGNALSTDGKSGSSYDESVEIKSIEEDL